MLILSHLLFQASPFRVQPRALLLQRHSDAGHFEVSNQIGSDHACGFAKSPDKGYLDKTPIGGVRQVLLPGIEDDKAHY